jgi:hypothetical protein
MRKLAITGHIIGRFSLRFDQPASASLDLYGIFEIRSLGHSETYEPPCPDWVRDVLRSLIGIKVLEAKYRRWSNLTIRFDDGGQLYIPDGPFENWHFRKMGLHVVGGCGRVVTF